MNACMNSKDGLRYTHNAYNIFEQTVKKIGTLPMIFLDGSTTAFSNNSSYYFLENICRQIADRSELSARNGLRQNELNELFEESYAESLIVAEENHSLIMKLSGTHQMMTNSNYDCFKIF
jgi:hypothetical protein